MNASKKTAELDMLQTTYTSIMDHATNPMQIESLLVALDWKFILGTSIAGLISFFIHQD